MVLFLVFYFLNKDNKLNDKAIDKGKLADYDLILSKGQSFQSKLISIFNLTIADYTHVGIIHKEGNEVYILHSTPDGTKENGIRYDCLKTFIDLSDASDVTVLRFKEISDFGRQMLKKEFVRYRTYKAPFDYNFNNFEERKIYCTELAYLIYTHSNVMEANIFNLKNYIQPKYFLTINDFYEIPCKK